jgi:hypothetical protein
MGYGFIGRGLKMKTQSITIIAAVIFLLAACEVQAVIVNSNSVVEDGIEYYIQTDKSVYNLGENVLILYRVTNLTDVSVNLGTLLPDPPDNYDLRIMQGDDQIWWYPYTAITLVIRDFILQPLETKEFQTNWNMMNDNGTPWLHGDDSLITPGTYDVVGKIALWAVDERVPVSVSVDVVPEPATFLLFGTGLIIVSNRNRREVKK